MKTILLILASIFFISCSNPKYQIQTECNLSIDDLFKSITTLLMQENFLIKQSDIRLGYLQAETIPEFDDAALMVGSSSQVYKIWVFQYKQGKIIATARSIRTIKQNHLQDGSQIYYSDKINKNKRTKWYWNIRNGLENLCGNKIVIAEIE